MHMKAKFKVKLTLSDNSVRWITKQYDVAVLEESLATMYRDFIDTHGYASPDEAVGLSWGGEFGSIEYLTSMGVKRILVIKNVELIKINT